MSTSQQQQFEGLYTAIVTPFDSDGGVDEQAFRALLNLQIEGKVAGVVVCGTTGEGPTVSDEEFTQLIRLAKEVSNGMMQVIAGSGTNSTAHTITRSQLAQQSGADALLISSPYYNKPSQQGVIAHFQAVANSVDLPIILYNVPGRTAVNIQTATLKQLALHPKIVAVKEASGDLNQIMDVIEAVSDSFAVLSGDDALTLSIIAAGGKGAISVVSNQAPAQMNEMVQAALRGEMRRARDLHYRLYPLMKANFWESNPMVVKAALKQMGLIEEVLRLPLVPLSKALHEPVAELLQSLSLLDGTTEKLNTPHQGLNN